MCGLAARKALQRSAAGPGSGTRDPKPGLLDRMLKRDEERRMKSALQTLSPADQEMLALYYLQDLELCRDRRRHRQAHRPSAVQVHRALRRLKSAMGRTDEGVSPTSREALAPRRGPPPRGLRTRALQRIGLRPAPSAWAVRPGRRRLSVRRRGPGLGLAPQPPASAGPGPAGRFLAGHRSSRPRACPSARPQGAAPEAGTPPLSSRAPRLRKKRSWLRSRKPKAPCP